MTIADDIAVQFESVLGADAVIRAPEERIVYECDAFTLVRSPPGLVVLPNTAEQVAEVVRLCARHELPFVPRGAGTGLAGGTASQTGAVMIGLNRLTRIRRIDLRNRFAEVEAGLVNLRLSRAVAGAGYHFAPDPSSQSASTIGGNVATNAGGPHTLKHGVTVNHVLGLEIVLPDGRLVRTGGEIAEAPGIDLTGLVVGSEGTFGIVTAAVVRLTHLPESVRTLMAVFDAADDATQSVSDIVAAGTLPAAMEMMDQGVICAVEAAFGVGFPLDAAAVLIVEIDGPAAGLERAMADILEICRRNRARTVRAAQNEEERALLWKSRKRAAGAFGRITTSYCTQDGVVPRSELPAMLRDIADIGRRHGIRVANLVHAGDGNIHPILMYDERDSEEVRRVLAASREIMQVCIRRGGTITGEHGIGIEKIEFMPLLFSPGELRVMSALRAAFNPRGLCNPGKLLPDSKGCMWEIHKPGKRAAV